MTTKAQQEFLDSLSNPQVQVETSPEQQEFLKSLGEGYEAPTDVPVETQRLQAFAQGLSFGFADELQGLYKSLRNKGVSYEQARDEVRQELVAYAEKHPKEALALEMAGAVLPTLVSVFGGPAAWSAAVKNAFSFGRSIYKTGAAGAGKSIATTAHRAGLGTATYSAGKSEKKGKGLVTDIGTGYAFGATIGGTLAGIGHIGSGWGVKLVEWARKKGGKKLEEPVRKELLRLQEKTGLTADEIVDKVLRGELIAENQSLLYAIKTAVAESGTASKALKDALEKRPAITRKELQETMKQTLKEGSSSERLTKIWKQQDLKFTKAENKRYDKIFKGVKNKELDGEMTDILLQSIRKFEGGAETINRMYAGQSITRKKFYDLDKDGTVTLSRQPTLHDAEIIYRAMRNETQKLWRSGETELYHMFKVNTAELKTAIDKFSPSLKKTRDKARDLRIAREAYKDGKRMWNKSEDEVADYIDDIISNTSGKVGERQAMEALRTGLLVTLKGKDAPGILRNIASEDKNLHQVIMRIFPDESLDDIFLKAGIATQAATAASKIPIVSGSPTQPLQEATKQASKAANLASAKEGSLGGILMFARDFVMQRGGLSSKEAEKLVEVVTSKNPTLVKKALIDDNAMNRLQQLLDSAIYAFARVGGDIEAKVRGSEIAQQRDPAHGVLESLSRGIGQFTGFQE